MAAEPQQIGAPSPAVRTERYDRVPPHNLDAEISVVGSMLLSKNAIAEVSELVGPEDFYRGAHRTMFEAIRHLYERGEPVDAVTLADELEARGKLVDVGGAVGIADIIQRVPMAANALYYARIVAEQALRRRLIDAGTQIARLGYEAADGADEAVDAAEGLVYQVAQRGRLGEFVLMKSLLMASFERIERLHEQSSAITGLATGFVDLDELTAGLQPGNLVIVAARPAMGKCVHGATPVLDPSTGALRTVAEVCEAGRRGVDVQVVSLGPELRLRPSRACAFADNGVQPVFRLRTRLGRELVATATHPLLTLEGWLPLAALDPGRRIATPRALAYFGTDALPDAEVAQLACLVGAGGLDNPALLRTSVPAAVFRLPRPQLALFLNRLFARGGSLDRNDDRLQVTFTSASATLIGQLQHLLLRFGVIAGIRLLHSPAADRTDGTAWELQVTDPSSIRTFAEEIGALGGDSRRGATAGRRPSQRQVGGWSPSETLPAQHLSVSHDVLLRPAAPDLHWDEIVSIEPAGEQRVYDLTVPDDHNFVAADLVVHNSTLITNIATHIAVEQRKPVVLFSLEMSQIELVDRILAAEARVDFDRLRTGRLHDSDWPKLSQAMGRLAEAPLFIDDSPGSNVMEIRSKCRRLKQKHGLDLAIVDYLQLMQPHRRLDNRVQEVSELSRGLKILAKELDIPVVALSQLSRKPEERTDRRPQLADLRESGCLTADARVLRADSGAETTMGELYASGQRDIPVWTVDHDLKLVVGTMTHVFASGTKPVFALRLASGRKIKASANHPFLTLDGWRRLDELSEGIGIAVPGRLGEPAHATAWTEPEMVVLAHLTGAGSAAPGQPIRYSSARQANVEALDEAARSLGLMPRRARQGGRWQLYLPSWQRLTPGHRDPIACWLQGLGRSGRSPAGRCVPSEAFSLNRSQVALFLRHLWATDGHRSPGDGHAPPCYASVSRRLVDDLQLLLLRLGIHSHIRSGGTPGGRPTYELAIGDAESRLRFLQHVGVRGRDPAAAAAVSGPVGRRAGAIVADPPLEQLADADLSWDRVVALEALGPQPVFDATVLETHNFIANNVVVENSIEQDSDIVCFIYRDEVYNQDSAAKGEAELIVAKHRNGPLRTIRLSFIGHQARFASMARAPLPGGGPPRPGRPGAGPV